jgi:beta-galactosidase
MPKLLLIALLLLCIRAGFARVGPDKTAADTTTASDATSVPDTTTASDTTITPNSVTAQDTTLPLHMTVMLLPGRPAVHLATTAARNPVTPAPPSKPALITKTALIRIYNPSAVTSLANIALDWELQADGVIRQKGQIGNLTIGPRQEKLVHLLLRISNDEEDEIFLYVSYRLQPVGSAQPAGAPIPDGPILAQEQILLKAAAGKSLTVAPAGELSFTDENDTFSIRSPAIHIAFNKQTGWLQHYEVNGTDLLEDSLGLKSNFWLPAEGRVWLPAQERGWLPAQGSGSRPSGVLSPAASGDSVSRPSDSAKSWLEATRNPRLQLFSTSTGSELVIVRTEYTLPATSCLLHLSYTINAAGEMLVSQQLEPDTAQTGYPLPCFGMQWTLPAGYDSVTYYGKNPDSTSRIAIYRKKVIPLSAPDIHPRGTAAGTDIRWWKITGQDGRGLLITADSFCLDLSALHPPQTQLNIDYPHFDMPYANYRYAFKVSPVLTGHP